MIRLKGFQLPLPSEREKGFPIDYMFIASRSSIYIPVKWTPTRSLPRLKATRERPYIEIRVAILLVRGEKIKVCLLFSTVPLTGLRTNE